MDKLLIVGAGGHGREILEILVNQRGGEEQEYPLGFVDDNELLHGTSVGGLEVLCGVETAMERWSPQEVKVVCAIGDPKAHSTVANLFESRGYEFANVVSINSIVSNSAVIGKGVIVFPNVFISNKTYIGDHVTVNVGSTISHDSVVGAYSNINPGTHIAGNVKIGSHCYVGMGTNIIQNLTIGNNVTLGAGSVVIRDIDSGDIAYGVPAVVR